MAKRILLVDDEPSEREPLARILRDRGFDVQTAGDTDEATRLAREFVPDIAVVDIGLPLLPGESLACYLNNACPRTKIIFISGQYSMVDPERFGENTVFLRKPLDIEGLILTLEDTSVAGTSPEP